jgi:phosphoribosyl 1,2-cyclic phosphodiesterase
MIGWALQGGRSECALPCCCCACRVCLRASLNQGTTGVLCVACTHSTKRTRCLTTLVLRNSLNQIVLVHRFVDMCQGFKKFKVFVGL